MPVLGMSLTVFLGGGSGQGGRCSEEVVPLGLCQADQEGTLGRWPDRPDGVLLAQMTHLLPAASHLLLSAATSDSTRAVPSSRGPFCCPAAGAPEPSLRLWPPPRAGCSSRVRVSCPRVGRGSCQACGPLLWPGSCRPEPGASFPGTLATEGCLPPPSRCREAPPTLTSPSAFTEAQTGF